MLNYILARLQEPSTFAGLSVLLAVVGVHVSDAIVQAVVHAFAANAAVAAAIMAEKSKAAALVTPVQSTPNAAVAA